MLAFFGATLRSGADIVIEATRLRDRLRGADLCITGEGRLDAGSIHGKAPVAVARVCKELGIRCVAIVGCAGEGAELTVQEGIQAYFPINDGTLPLSESILRAGDLVEQAVTQIMEWIRRSR
jgi:glycerate kinase